MTLERDIQPFNQQIKQAELIGKNKRIIMAQYTNSTRNSDDWNFDFHSFPYSEGLFVLLVFLYGLKIQLRKPNHQRNVRLIKEEEVEAKTFFTDATCTQLTYGVSSNTGQDQNRIYY